MIVRAALLVLMAIGLAGFGMVAWVSTRPPHQAAAEPAPPVNLHVLSAARTLQAGSLLRPDDLTDVEIASRDAPKGVILDTPQLRGGLLGAMMRRSLATGELLLEADAMRPGDHGFLAAVLAPGMRGISVGVDAVSGTAGLIWPGDRVDLILTQGDAHADHGISAIRVLSDVRVIAIDQQMVQGITSTSATTQAPARTVTLEVSDGQAERVAVAQRLGSLSLAVRSAEQATAAATQEANDIPPAVWERDVSPALPVARTTLGPSVVRVWAGVDEGKEFQF